MSDYKLSEFEANNHFDIAQVRTEILKEWLRNEYPPTWQKLAAAVRKTGDGNLAWRLDGEQCSVDSFCCFFNIHWSKHPLI